MDNKNEVKQELNPDQMEQISGGDNASMRVCRYCGQEHNWLNDPSHAIRCRERALRHDTTGDT